MKKIVLIGITLLLVAPFFAGCNGVVTQEALDAVLAATEAAQAEITALQSQLDAVQSDLDAVQSDLDAADAEIAEIEESLYIVSTNAGRVRGTVEKEVLAFKGIHYGASNLHWVEAN